MTMRAMRYAEGTAPSVSPDTIPNVSKTTVGVMYPRPSPTMDHSPRLRFSVPEAAIPILPDESCPPPLGARVVRMWTVGSDVLRGRTVSYTERVRVPREIVMTQERNINDSTLAVEYAYDIGSPGLEARWPLSGWTGPRSVRPWSDRSEITGN